MPGATTFYQFPYPIGTDPISDGDDQIKALAERVESVLKGTAAARSWAARVNTPFAFGASTWSTVVSVPLTGCPVGAVVLVMGSMSAGRDNISGVMEARHSSAGATFTPPGGNLPLAHVTVPSTSSYQDLATFSVGTVTAAAPTITMEGFVTAGNCFVHESSHLVVTRLV